MSIKDRPKKSGPGAKSREKSSEPLSLIRTSQLSRRVKAFLRKEIKEEVARQIRQVQKTETPEDTEPWNPKNIQKDFEKARKAIPQDELEQWMIEWNERFLPVCQILVEKPGLEVAGLQDRKDLDPQVLSFLSSLRGLRTLYEAKHLQRYASYKSVEAQARFLSRAAVGIVFGMSASTAESLVRRLLAEKRKRGEKIRN